jgi:FKBP-type peptidyl-prolyl cis-trans isomerase FklB
MKCRILIAAVLTAISLSAYADASNTTTSSSTATENNQTLKNLTTASTQGSAVLPNNNSAASTTATTSAGNSPLTDETDRVSYSMGFDIGRTFKKQNLTINPDAIAQGIQDGLSGSKMQMTQKDMQATLVNFQKQLIAKHQIQMDQISDTNKKESDAFLTANKSKPGVVTLPDGLQYKVISAGKGNAPTDKDIVMVNYEGTFPNGQIFDSSYARGKPVTFPVAEVIQGWSEALKLMKPGAVWEIAVPPDLAYGERGVGPIGPNQTLLFKIELLSINPPQANKAPSPADVDAPANAAAATSANNNGAKQ